MSQNQSTTVNRIQALLNIEETTRQQARDMQHRRVELVARGIDQHISLSGAHLVFTIDETAMYHYELADIRRDGGSIMAEVEQALQVPADEDLDGDTLGSFLLNQSGFHISSLLAHQEDLPAGPAVICQGSSSTDEPMEVLVSADALLAHTKEHYERYYTEKYGAK